MIVSKVPAIAEQFGGGQPDFKLIGALYRFRERPTERPTGSITLQRARVGDDLLSSSGGRNTFEP